MIRLVSIFWVSLIVVACSSGGSNSDNKNESGGSLGEASVDTPEGLSEAVIQSTRSVISAQFVPDFDFFGDEFSAEAQAERIEVLASLPAGARETTTDTQNGPCGGSMTMVSVTETPNNSEVFFPFSVDMDITYRNFCYDEGYVVNGTGTVSMVASSIEALSYDVDFNISITGGMFAGGSYVYQFSQSCATVNQVEQCTDAVTYESGYSNLSFEVSGFDVEGGEGTPYDIEGPIEIEGESYLLRAEGLTLCDNGNFGAGNIELTIDGVEYLYIEFVSCTQYTYVYEGVAGTETY